MSCRTNNTILPAGSAGYNGWTPKIVTESYNGGIVLKVTGYIGGTGTAPTTPVSPNNYIGTSGYVAIGSATLIKTYTEPVDSSITPITYLATGPIPAIQTPMTLASAMTISSAGNYLITGMVRFASVHEMHASYTLTGSVTGTIQTVAEDVWAAGYDMIGTRTAVFHIYTALSAETLSLSFLAASNLTLNPVGGAFKILGGYITALKIS